MPVGRPIRPAEWPLILSPFVTIVFFVAIKPFVIFVVIDNFMPFVVNQQSWSLELS